MSFNPLNKEILDIAETVKKVLQKEVDEPRAKGEKDFKALHKGPTVDDPEQDPKNVKGVKFKMSEGKMKELHALVKGGITDPKKVSEKLGLPNTKEVHKAIGSLISGMEEGLDPVNRKAVTKDFKNRKDKDIDNDGDVDDSDEYLHKKRKAISKAIKKDDRSNIDKKKVAQESTETKSAQLNEADAAYLIYKDKTTAKTVELYIRRKYRNSSEVEMAPMDDKNFGVSIFAPKVQNIVKDVTKKYGKPDDQMMESTELVEADNRLKAHTPAAAKRLIKKLKNKFSGYAWDGRVKGDEIIYPNEPYIKRFIKKQPEVADMKEEVSLEEAKGVPTYEIYHKSYSDAMQSAKSFAKGSGYEVDEDDWYNQVTTGPRKPGKDKVNRFSILLIKNGKEQKKRLQIQVTNLGTGGRPFELNAYIA